MTMIVFAALTGVALAISWGTVAAALRQSQQGQVSMDEAPRNQACGSRLRTSACGDRQRKSGSGVGRRGVNHFRARLPIDAHCLCIGEAQ
jgi:hypothetical protein